MRRQKGKGGPRALKGAYVKTTLDLGSRGQIKRKNTNKGGQHSKRGVSTEPLISRGTLNKNRGEESACESCRRPVLAILL